MLLMVGQGDRVLKLPGVPMEAPLPSNRLPLPLFLPLHQLLPLPETGGLERINGLRLRSDSGECKEATAAVVGDNGSEMPVGRSIGRSMKSVGEGEDGGAGNDWRGLAWFFGVIRRWGVHAKPLGLAQPLLKPPGVLGLCQLRRATGDRGAGEFNAPVLVLFAEAVAL